LTPAPNGNNSLSPSKRGEGWGEGFVLVNIGLLTPALSSLREAREKKWRVLLPDKSGVPAGRMRLDFCSIKVRPVDASAPFAACHRLAAE